MHYNILRANYTQQKSAGSTVEYLGEVNTSYRSIRSIYGGKSFNSKFISGVKSEHYLGPYSIQVVAPASQCWVGDTSSLQTLLFSALAARWIVPGLNVRQIEHVSWGAVSPSRVFTSWRDTSIGCTMLQ